jgi:hypothetical protein
MGLCDGENAPLRELQAVCDRITLLSAAEKGWYD